MHTAIFPWLCRLCEEKISEHAMACLSSPAVRLAPVVVVFIQCSQLLFFFCLWSSASFRTWWSSCHLRQYNPYSDKATNRDISTSNYQQLFNTANKQTYKTTKYQSSSWFSEENQAIVTPLLRNCVHRYERNSTKVSNHLFEKPWYPDHAQVIFDRSGLLCRCVKYSVSKSSDEKIPNAAKTSS